MSTRTKKATNEGRMTKRAARKAFKTYCKVLLESKDGAKLLHKKFKGLSDEDILEKFSYIDEDLLWFLNTNMTYLPRIEYGNSHCIQKAMLKERQTLYNGEPISHQTLIPLLFGCPVMLTGSTRINSTPEGDEYRECYLTVKGDWTNVICRHIKVDDEHYIKLYDHLYGIDLPVIIDIGLFCKELRRFQSLIEEEEEGAYIKYLLGCSNNEDFDNILENIRKGDLVRDINGNAVVNNNEESIQEFVESVN